MIKRKLVCYGSDVETAERQRAIVEVLRAEDFASVATLAASLGTSEVTVRRDLTELEALGVLRRTRGGARNLLLRGEEAPYRFREIVAHAEKQRIAAAAAGMIRDGEVVAIDSGTTGLEMARALAGRNITVMPLGAQQIAPLLAAGTTRVLMPGGQIRGDEGSVVGPIAERTLAAYRFDTFLLTTCGISAEQGVTAYDTQDAAVKQTAALVSARVIALADATKFTAVAMAHVLEARDLAAVVSDAGMPAAQVDRFTELGVEVRRVD